MDMNMPPGLPVSPYPLPLLVKDVDSGNAEHRQRI